MTQFHHCTFNKYKKCYKACQDKSLKLELDLDPKTNLNSVSPVGYSHIIFFE